MKEYIRKNKSLFVLCALVIVQILIAIVFWAFLEESQHMFQKIKTNSTWANKLSKVNWNFWDFLWWSGKAMSTHSNINRLQNYQPNVISELIIKFFTQEGNEYKASGTSAGNNADSISSFKLFNISVQICLASIFISGLTIITIVALWFYNFWKCIVINKRYEFFKLLAASIFNLWGLWCVYEIYRQKNKFLRFKSKLDKEVNGLKKIRWLNPIWDIWHMNDDFLLNQEIILKTQNLFCNPDINNKNQWIIKNINLEIKRGSFNIIIGPNGSGKSTLIKTLINIHQNISGKILWGSKKLSEINKTKFARKISYIPQFLNIENPISTKEFLSLSRYPYKKSLNSSSENDKKAIMQGLEKNNCLEFRNKLINELSGGQRQKILLTSVLTQETDVIILDEPTSFLDIKNQHLFLENIKEFNRQGKTIIMILHDLQQSIDYADNLIIMKNGEIKLSGHPKEIINKEVLKDIFEIDCQLREGENSIKLENIYAI